MMRYMIAIPCMEMMHTAFVSSLVNMRRVGANKVTFLSNSLIYDARNMLAAEALDTGADRILWLDSDMVFGVDLMQRLAEDMDDGRDIVSGLCFRRRFPMAPIISREVDRDGVKALQVYEDYPQDQVFEVAAFGFGACMMSREVLKNVWDKYGSPFYPINGHGEDFSFCERAKSLGYRLYCDSRIKVGHVGSMTYDEAVYRKQGAEKNGTT